MMLSNKGITKELTSLRECAGWSGLLLFTNPEDRFSWSRPKFILSCVGEEEDTD